MSKTDVTPIKRSWFFWCVTLLVSAFTLSGLIYGTYLAGKIGYHYFTVVRFEPDLGLKRDLFEILWDIVVIFTPAYLFLVAMSAGLLSLFRHRYKQARLFFCMSLLCYVAVSYVTFDYVDTGLDLSAQYILSIIQYMVMMGLLFWFAHTYQNKQSLLAERV